MTEGEKIMKLRKIIAMTAAMAAVISLAACGSKDAGSADQSEGGKENTKEETMTVRSEESRVGKECGS